MKTSTAWLVYSLLRVVFFAVPFAALMLIGWKWWFAALVATLVGVSLSVIFLAKPRETAAKGVYDWRNRDRTADDIAEDEAIEAVESETADDRTIAAAGSQSAKSQGASEDNTNAAGESESAFDAAADKDGVGSANTDPAA